MLWLAHGLTLSRLPIAAALVAAYGRTGWAIALVALAAATDTADGTVARALQRRGHTEPAIGGWLDPLVDKIFIAVVVGAIAWHTRDVVLVLLIGARELVLVPLVIAYLARHRPTAELRADALGKAATVAQFFACAVALASPPHAYPLAIAAAVLGLAAVVHYVRLVTRAPVVIPPASSRSGDPG
jgi:phosphatidylglycerophosphate synthase